MMPLLRSLGRQRGPDAPRYGADRLFRDAASLASSSIVNAVFGMALVAISAHLIAPATLGIMTAVLAVINTCAIVVSSTIGGAYTPLIPAVGLARVSIFRRGQRLFYVGSTVAGIVGGIVTIVSIGAVRGSFPVFLLVVLGTVMVAKFMLQSNIMASIGRANWLLTATTSMGLVRIAVLCAIALTFQWHSFELSALISAGLVSLSFSPMIRRIIETSDSLPTTSSLPYDEAVREFHKLTVRTFALTVLGYAMFSLSPFLVTAFSGAKQGALFALALPISQTLDLISTAMGTSLVVHASAEPAAAKQMARSVFVKAVVITAAGAVLVTPAISPILRFLNPEYLSMGAVSVVAVLCIGPITRTYFVVWCALQRARRELRPTWIVGSIGTAVSLVMVPILSHAYGALGGALGLTLAYIALSAGALIHTLFVRRSQRNNEATNSVPDC